MTPADTDFVMDVPTGSGLARITWNGGIAANPIKAILLLGHGAGGGIAAPDLLHIAALARKLAIAVGLVEQPYRVAGKRAPVPAPRLDASFITIAEAARGQLEALGFGVPPLLLGGRSSGARVACRTAGAIGAKGVLALAFPLTPPQGAPGRERPSRLPELLTAGVPILIVQGERDSFGGVDQLRRELAGAQAPAEIEVSAAPGADHSLRKGIDGPAITEWLARFLP